MILITNFNVTVGELRNLIKIAHKEIKKEYGLTAGEKYVIDRQCKAKIQNLYGEEFYQAYQVNLQDSVNFIVRFTNNISYDNVVIFNNKVYEIKHLDNINYRNRWLKIKCKVIENDLAKVIEYEDES
nr:MAG TPA: Putative head tail adaptor [Caudoviricetes sp.]